MLALAMMLSAPCLRAGIIVVNLPDFVSPIQTTLPSAVLPVGTFTFDLAGETVTSATFYGVFGSLLRGGSASSDIYIDGIYVASPASTAFTTSFQYNFPAAQLSVLGDGNAQVTAIQTGDLGYQVQLRSLSLVLSTVPTPPVTTPEPSFASIRGYSVVLLLALLANRRKRMQMWANRE